MVYGSSIGSLTLFRFEGRVLIKPGRSVIKKVSQSSGSSDVARFTKSLRCEKTPAIKEASNYRRGMARCGSIYMAYMSLAIL